MLKKIKAHVNSLLESLSINEPPVDLLKIAKHLNLQVEYQPLQGEISGCLIRREKGATVGINSLEHLNRQRFTLAHEIGHYLLHEGEKTFIDRQFFSVNMRDSRSRDSRNLEETEANNFAAQLLIPQEFLEKDLRAIEKSEDVENGDAIQELASKYIVSRQALMLRLAAFSFK